MRRVIVRRASLIWGLLIFVSPLAVPQPSESAPKPPATSAEQSASTQDSEPKLEISVAPADKHRTISGGFDVYVTVTNTTPQNIIHWDTGICFPRAIWSLISPSIQSAHVERNAVATNVGLPAYSPCWRPARQTPGPREGFELRPGRQAYFHLDVPKVDSWISIDEVLFRRDNYGMQVYTLYEVPGKIRDTRIARLEKAVEFRPSLIAPLSGVVIGTLLVSVFMALRRSSQLAALYKLADPPRLTRAARHSNIGGKTHSAYGSPA